MFKRGQFTLFVVLGLVLVLLVGLFFVFKDDLFSFVGLSSTVTYPSEVQEVVDHIQACVESSSENAVSSLGYSGGYFQPPLRSYVSSDLGLTIPYYYDDGEDLTLSSSGMEEELRLSVSQSLENCLDLEQFSDFTFSFSEMSIESQIELTSALVLVSYPFTVQVGDAVYTVDETYEISVVTSLGNLRTIAETIVDYDIENPETLDSSFLLGQGLTKITVTPVSENTYIYVLQDSSLFNGEKNETFIFAEYYSNLASYGDCYEDADCLEGYSCEEGVCTLAEEGS